MFHNAYSVTGIIKLTAVDLADVSLQARQAAHPGETVVFVLAHWLELFHLNLQ